MSSTRVLVVQFLPMLWALVLAQDANWGIKVKCYMVDGTAVCPDCNSRAGLSCPRFDPDMDRKCEGGSLPPVIVQKPEPPEDMNTPECDEQAAPTKATEAIDTSKSDAKSEVTTPISDTKSEVTPPINEISFYNKDFQRNLKSNIDMQIFLYRILRPSLHGVRRVREVDESVDLEEGTCRWNGDCPCPMICCRAGEGCPRKCKMGIRLPPPWG